MTLPTRIIEVVVRTVDRVKDRSALVGISFLGLGLAGCIFTPWVLLAALGFYLIWAFQRLSELYLQTRRAGHRADERLATAINEAIGRLDHQRVIQESVVSRTELREPPRIAQPEVP